LRWDKLCCAGALATIASVAFAQTDSYPNRPIRLIVPYPPGASTNDILGRGLAQRLGPVLGQQVVVDNRAGASGTLGSEVAAKSAPDGYTLLVAVASPLAVGPAVYPKLGFHPVRDFAPIARIATIPYIMAVHPSLPANNVQELIALAKRRPGQINFASSGNGGTPHLCSELFKLATGVEMPPAPPRLSTTNVCPSASVYFFARSRAVMSVVPPGEAGTMIRTGLAGQLCACADITAHDSTMMTAAAIDFMRFLRSLLDVAT